MDKGGGGGGEGNMPPSPNGIRLKILVIYNNNGELGILKQQY